MVGQAGKVVDGERCSPHVIGEVPGPVGGRLVAPREGIIGPLL